MQDTIRALQDKVNAALLGGDWATLQDLVADDCVVVGPRGFAITKDTWIGAHQDSGYQQVRLEPLETEVHAYDGAGIRLDVLDSECVYGGETITGRFRVMQAWAQAGGEWQLVAVQYTAMPAEQS